MELEGQYEMCIRDRWRAEVKPLVSQASEHPETFDPEAFDRELCAIFDTIRPEEVKKERIKQKSTAAHKKVETLTVQ